MNNIINNMIKLTLCQKNCCPTVECSTIDNIVTIQDDDGGKVLLTFDQFRILLDQFRGFQGE